MWLLLLGSLLSAAVADPPRKQLPNFKNLTDGPIGTMTTSNGAKIDIEDISALSSHLIYNEYFMESMTHLVRERIPERVVHAKGAGAGAFGYFQVTHDVTDICKAKLFSNIGKKTPIYIRLSPRNAEKGGADTLPDSRGMAVKFYTEDGNFDLLCLTTPMFMIKDPSLFPSLVRSMKRNPATNLPDKNMMWDFITLRPETMFHFMYLYAGNGIPCNYRYMPGFSIHTYQLYNEDGESYFARFHIMPDLGIKNLKLNEAFKLVAKDLDYYSKDLYEAVDRGEFPSWTVYMQVLTLEDVEYADFDVFDVTKILPLDQYPLKPVGKIVLNRNPKNYFKEMELSAASPSNIVPGILGAPDKMFEARRLVYRDAHLYRLGANFDNIPVNCPHTERYTYNRNGLPPVGSNGGDSPNYYPNSFNGPVPYIEKNRPELISVVHDDSYNFDQAADMYKEMSEVARCQMIDTFVYYLHDVEKRIQDRAMKIFYTINKELGQRFEKALRGSKIGGVDISKIITPVTASIL